MIETYFTSPIPTSNSLPREYNMGGLAESCLADFNVNWGEKFERIECSEAITHFLKNTNINTSTTCMQYLFVGGVNTSPDNPLLTLDGCKALCGPDWGYYPDSITRVVEWVVPIVFLLSNINLSPAERRTMMGIVHALGDPIDTLWSLLDKLYAWYICSQEARRAVENPGMPQVNTRLPVPVHHQGSVGSGTGDGGGDTTDRNNDQGLSTVENSTIPPGHLDIPDINEHVRNTEAPTTPEERIRIIATVLGGIEELAGYVLEKPAEFYQNAIKSLGNVAVEDTSPNAPIKRWKEAALSLVDDHTNEFLRTGMAVTLYLFHLLSLFIDQISQNSENTPGGRIGAAMILSWLIPVALLSNLLGGFPSRRSNLKHFLPLIKEAALPAHHRLHLLPGNDQRAMATTNKPLSREHQEHYSSWESYFNAQQSTGAIYGFRPFKTRAICHAKGADFVVRLCLPVVASLPVIVSFVVSFLFHLWAVPEGFSCRHVWIVIVFGLWCLSPTVTWLCFRFLPNATVSWWVIFVKDAMIGSGTISIIIASVIGVFNSCFCWSLAMVVGESAAEMVVNTRGQYLSHKKRLYPVTAGSCVFAQLVFIGALVFLSWNGLGVMRWGEKAKRKQWDELRREELQVLHNFLSSSSGRVTA